MRDVQLGLFDLYEAHLEGREQKRDNADDEISEEDGMVLVPGPWFLVPCP